LEAIGVPDGELPKASAEKTGRFASLLAEADPVLSQTVDEVRNGLEATLRLLDEALSVGGAPQTPPQAPRKKGH